MSLIKCLIETINGDDIFHKVLQYFNDKDIPLTNLINTASDGSAAVTEKVKGFNSRINLFPHKSFMPIALSTDCISLQRILEEACKKYSTLPYVQLSSSNQIQCMILFLNSAKLNLLIPYFFTRV